MRVGVGKQSWEQNDWKKLKSHRLKIITISGLLMALEISTQRDQSPQPWPIVRTFQETCLKMQMALTHL